MLVSSWLRTPRIRRGLAAASVILATGGLVLFRAPTSAALDTPVLSPFDANNAAKFSGPGAHGIVALSQAKVLAQTDTDVYAEVRMTADKAAGQNERAPLALAVVLDTSGSMSGEKIEQAKNAVLELIRDMRDDDEIAVVRYSDDAGVVQRLSRVGSVRNELSRRVQQIDAGGGTAIPVGLSAGLAQLGDAERGRVQRVVLVSDGLDSTRAQAELLAQNSFAKGVSISSIGIGLDFDESYMSGVARAGHGNFGFVKDASTLASFLHRELDETASTTIANASVRLKLPHGVRFVSVSGADASVLDSDQIELKLGSLFAGDERRAIVHLTARLDSNDALGVEGTASWTRVGGADQTAAWSGITLASANDPASVQASIDHGVYADATSVIASERELKAAEAYAKGDTTTANALIDENMRDLKQAAILAPAPTAATIAKQLQSYDGTKKAFKAAPSSAAGKDAAKRAFEVDNANMARSAF